MIRTIKLRYVLAAAFAAGGLLAVTPAVSASATPTVTGTAVIGARTTDALVTVPDLVGRSLSVATTRLHQVGLTQRHGTVVSCEGVPGTVIAATPEEGSVVPVGTSVFLTLARAPAPGDDCE
jgi:beta-lactam-binding protein with PASTA domain